MHPLAELARKAVEEFTTTGRILPPPQELTPEMRDRAGVFVCLKKKNGELRGCIGTFMPCCRNVAEEIIRNAVAASREDPRFFPVEAAELSDLTYSVDVLSPPERIESVEVLDPKRYGVIVEHRGLRGLLLPDLEGVDTVEEQLRIVKMKAGISMAEDCIVHRFEVERYC
ncbi:MAG TPA: AMMECR1 domain-containing protein [Nitrospiraceae bacterium]|jgi:AmmeMemoRadiSam system protein A|nr:AMMECR1 domain-containing protein [Nitrospiraceae bacterium]